VAKKRTLHARFFIPPAGTPKLGLHPTGVQSFELALDKVVVRRGNFGQIRGLDG
jgi:hypothetical protein